MGYKYNVNVWSGPQIHVGVRVRGVSVKGGSTVLTRFYIFSTSHFALTIFRLTVIDMQMTTNDKAMTYAGCKHL